MQLLDELETLVAPISLSRSSLNRSRNSYGEAIAYETGRYKNEYGRRKRVATDNANDESLPLSILPESEVPPVFSRQDDLLDVEDRRTFDPQRVSGYPRNLKGVSARIGRNDELSPGKVQSKRYILWFKTPQGVAICIRRKARREIMHAKGIAGTKVRSPNRTPLSRISCAEFSWRNGLGLRFTDKNVLST